MTHDIPVNHPDIRHGKFGLQVVNELRQQIRAAANEAQGAGFLLGRFHVVMGVPGLVNQQFAMENHYFFMGKSTINGHLQ